MFEEFEGAREPIALFEHLEPFEPFEPSEVSNAPMPRPPDELVQVRALTAAFFARFFESDTTAERTDATRSFFWLLAILAAPGLLLTMYRQFLWERMARRGEGVAALHQAVRADTAEYLALTFVGVAVVAAARWQSLVIDRRDALVLGTLPARPRSIVIAKLAALAGYTGLLAAGMHLGSALVHGISLGGLERPTNVLGTTAGLAIAGMGLTVFVMSAVASIQSATLALVGPRQFARSSVTMQMALVALVLVVFVLMPGRSARAFSTFDADGIGGPAWVVLAAAASGFSACTSPSQGTRAPSSRRWLGTGWSAMALAVGVLLVASPIAGARTLRAAFAIVSARTVVRPADGSPIGWRACSHERPAARGAVAFTLATLGRVSGPRLVFALLCAAGPDRAGARAGCQAVRTRRTRRPPSSPFRSSCSSSRCSACGSRSARPVELPGRWLFDQTDVRRSRDEPPRGESCSSAGWSYRCSPPACSGSGCGSRRSQSRGLVAALAGGWLALEVLLVGVRRRAVLAPGGERRVPGAHARARRRLRSLLLRERGGAGWLAERHRSRAVAGGVLRGGRGRRPHRQQAIGRRQRDRRRTSRPASRS